jgi:hypothetical protein
VQLEPAHHIIRRLCNFNHICSPQAGTHSSGRICRRSVLPKPTLSNTCLTVCYTPMVPGLQFTRSHQIHERPTLPPLPVISINMPPFGRMCRTSCHMGKQVCVRRPIAIRHQTFSVQRDISNHERNALVLSSLMPARVSKDQPGHEGISRPVSKAKTRTHLLDLHS